MSADKSETGKAYKYATLTVWSLKNDMTQISNKFCVSCHVKQKWEQSKLKAFYIVKQ